MKKQYTVIETSNSKFYKDVPYISKKEFKENNDAIVVGQTKLKKYKSSSEDKELDFLVYEEQRYEIKNKIFGFKKGYVYTGDNNYVLMKWRIPFLFLLFLLLLLFLFFFYINLDKDKEEPIVEKPVEQEIVIPEEKEEEPKKEEVIPPKKETPKKQNKPVVSLPKEYEIVFNANGGYGNMKNITCTIDKECTLTKNDFKRDGYTFIGWSISKDSESLYDNETKVNNLTTKSGDIITLYAVWEIKSFKISFLDYDESIIYDEVLNYGVEIINPEDPVRSGYTFTGWDKQIDIVKEETLFTALYEINSYDISYNLNGGTLDNAPKDYNVESKDISIPSPKKVGYTFMGWNITDNDELIKDYIIKQGSVNDIELNANYEANTYNLIFNSDSSNDSLISRQIKFDSNYGELPDAYKDGYVFKGWKNQSGDFVSSDTIYDVPEDINLYAEWETITYDISYNLNGGTLEDAPKSFDAESKDINIPSPKKEGFNFIGWTTSYSSTPVKDYIIQTGTVGNQELVANYEPITYYISYNSSNSEGNMDKDEIKYQQTFNLSKNSFVKEGYNFVGWSTSKDGEVVYKDQDEIFNLSSNDNETIKLYAKWEIIKLSVKYYDLFDVLLKQETVNYGSKSKAPSNPFIDGYTFIEWNSDNEPIKQDTVYKARYSVNEYRVRYNLNMGKSDDEVAINYNVESDTIVLPNPTRTGYTFKGWTGSNGVRPQLDLVVPKGSTGNKYYTANWSSNIYDVNLNANGGILDVKSLKVAYNSDYGIIPSPTRVGYTFEGWYDGETLIEESSVQKKEYNHELLAKWKVINYDISYDLNGGSADNLKTIYNIETETFTLPIPTKKGYKFLGWTGSNGSTPSTNVSIEQGSIGEKSYTANWQVITYNISYNLNGGSASTVSTYNVESSTIKLPTPTRTGYTFKGWTGSNGSTPSTNVSIEHGSVGDKSYTANWQVINYDITYNLAGGSASPLQTSYNVESNSFTLPTPSRTGYTFTGWTGTGLSSASKSVSVNKGSTGNRSYTANWSINYYTVNYYVNGSLWATRSTAYNSSLENLNAQDALDRFHTFHGWDGWVDKMPTRTVNLYADITEAYCGLMTGHGPYGNAEALLNVFKSAGWTGRIEEAPSAPGMYWVVTDATLTRAEAEYQKNYIAAHTNYTNYNFPYLYWVAVSCTNGIGDTWTRGGGESTFTSIWN